MRLTLQGPNFRPSAMRKQPFVVTTSIQGAATSMRITLHLSDAIDEAYRIHSFQHTVSVGEAAEDVSNKQSMPCQQVYTFTTQTVAYESELVPPSPESAEPSSAILLAAKRHKADA